MTYSKTWGMKSATHRKGVLHVETPLGIVNIHVGLYDRLGRRVEHVEVIPNRYAGELKVLRRGNRLIECKGAKS